jgi:hypothetical protein
MVRRAKKQTLPLMEALEDRHLLSTTVVSHAVASIVVGENTPVIEAQVQGFNVVAAMGGLSNIHVAVAWDDGTVASGSVALATDQSIPNMPGMNGFFPPLNVLINGGTHTVGTHHVFVYVWQDSGGRFPKLLNSVAFNGTTSVTQNSPGGTTFTATAGQTMNAKVGTLRTIHVFVIPADGSTTHNGVAQPSTQVMVNWGDGTSTLGTLVPTIDGNWDVYSQHVYTYAGTYRIAVRTVAATPLSSTLLALDTAVVSAPPALQATALTSSTFTLASLDAPNGPLVAGRTLTINWGDGTSSQARVVNNSTGGFDIQGAHTYAHAGAYEAQIIGLWTGTGNSVVELFDTLNVTTPPIHPVTFVKR